jgi:hypothetical protein
VAERRVVWNPDREANRMTSERLMENPRTLSAFCQPIETAANCYRTQDCVAISVWPSSCPSWSPHHKSHGALVSFTASFANLSSTVVTCIGEVCVLNLAAERVVLTRVVRIFKLCLSCICPLMYRDLWLFQSGGGCRLQQKLCLILYPPFS